MGAAGVLVGARITAIDALWTDAYRDDAGYYFDFVRKLVQGRGPIVGDGPPTSGVQVLWALVLVPLHALGGDTALEQGARWLGLLLLGSAGLLFARTLRREGLGSTLSALGGLWLVSDPLLVTEAQNGQESGLCALACVALLALRNAARAPFAAVCVLATLARAELLLLAVALAALRGEAPWRRALGPSLALLTWCVVNLLLAGRPVSDAGWPMAWLAHAQFLATEPGLAEWLRQLWHWSRPVAFGGPFAAAGIVGQGALLAIAWLVPLPRAVLLAALAVLIAGAAAGVDDVLVAGAALCVALLVGTPATTATPATRRTARALVFAGLAIVALHVAVRWSPREYYWVPLAVLASFGLAHAFDRVTRSSARFALAVLAVICVARDHATPPRRFAWQDVLVFAAERVRELVPERARIGAFNAGILAWRSGCRIVNLDGVVNGDAFAAMRERQLGRHLREQGIDWLLLDPLELETGGALHARGAFFGEADAPRFELVLAARFIDATLDDAARGLWRGELMLLGRRSRTDALPPPHFAVRALRPDGGRDIEWRGALGAALVMQHGEGARRVLVAASGNCLVAVRLPAAGGSGPVRLFELADGAEGALPPAPLLEYE